MKFNHFYNYLINCFILFIPVMLWDGIFTKHLPEAFQAEIFWRNIPAVLKYGENISRTLIFILAVVMPLRINTTIQRKGIVLYITGLLLYFISWLPLIWFPGETWSMSIPGFMAPAYTPAFWLCGIACLSDSFYFSIPYKRWFFIAASVLFLLFHNAHAYLVYCRLPA